VRTMGHSIMMSYDTYALFLLARSPDIQAELGAGAAQLMAGGPFRAEAREELPLARAVEEAVRLYPDAYVQDRTAAADLPIGDVTIEAGTRILISPWVIHRDARNVAEPARFLPERFLPERRRSIARNAFIPFGSGPKICVGNRFELEPADPHSQLIDPPLLEPAGTLGVPTGGLHAWVRPRDAAA
ncbi:MAG: cytochrome P450, partial [Chloroflexota bacterium]|nr:cytochrome P450 [Chloroflexota bacterium]